MTQTNKGIKVKQQQILLFLLFAMKAPYLGYQNLVVRVAVPFNREGAFLSSLDHMQRVRTTLYIVKKLLQNSSTTNFLLEQSFYLSNIVCFSFRSRYCNKQKSKK